MAVISMENKDISINLGKRIRENRQFRHMTGEQFCNEVGISQTFLWDIENVVIQGIIPRESCNFTQNFVFKILNFCVKLSHNNSP